MRFGRFAGVGALAFCASLLNAAELQTAGQMLVDLDAAALEGFAVGQNVEAWPNAGSEPDFAHGHESTALPTYQVRDGAPAVRFAGSSTGSLTNGVPTPAVLLGNQAWSVESWVAATRDQTDERCYLSLTSQGGLANNDLTKAGFRLDVKDATGLDHWNATLSWGRSNPDYRPVKEKWHYVCAVHEASGYERLYVNGHLASVLNRELKLDGTEPSFITISGYLNRDALTWSSQAYADIGQIRVQSGALTAAQVLNNFNAEKARYGVTDVADALWTDGGTWYDNNPFVQDGNLIIEGDQPVVFNNGASNEVHFITVKATKNTGLTIDNGSQLVVNPANNIVEFGNMAGGLFTFDVPNGQFDTPNNSLTIGAYSKGLATVGGRDDATGVLNIGSSLRIGNYATGEGELVIKKNGIVNVANTFRISDNGSPYNTATIEAGGVLNLVGDAYLSSGTGEGRMDVWGTINQGTTEKYPNFYLAPDVDSSKGTLWAHPGAELNVQTFRIGNDSVVAQGKLVLENATLRQNWTRTWWVSTQCVLEIKDRAVFDCDANVTRATIGALVRDITEDGHAVIEKTGPGTMNLSNDGSHAPISDPMTFIVKEGRLTIMTANTFATGHTSTFLVEEGAEISADYSGGAAELLRHIDPASKGTFVIHGNNSGEDLDFSAFPDLKISMLGVVAFTGRITPYQNKYVFYPVDCIMVYSANISDQNGQPASVEIYGKSDTDGVTLAGVNDGMSGNISVFKGVLGISGDTWAAGSDTTKLYLAEGTSLKLDARVGRTFFKQKVDPASKPAAILLTTNSTGCDIDLTMFPGCRVGTDVAAEEPVVHAGSLVPTADNEYLLGGGGLAYNNGNRGFMPAALVDTAAGPAKVQIATQGIVYMSNALNTYSGGTEILDNGVAFVTTDGFGAVPEEFDADNILMDGGVIRLGPANIDLALPATRGVKVGAKGAVFYPWSNSTLEIPGGLSGEGPIRITDGGHLTLSGERNTYNGHITGTSTATRLTIGGNDAYSWVSTGGIELAGTVVVKNVQDETFNDTISGTGGFTKEGAGTLTLTQPQTYTGPTVLAAGKLVLADGASLMNSSSFRNDGEVTVSSFGALGTGMLSGDGLFKVAGKVKVDASRISGNPNFEVLDGGAITVDAPAFGLNTQVKLDDGSAASLGSGVAAKIDGFGTFKFNGTAALAADELKLTPYAARAAGSAFYTRRVRVSEPWQVTYAFQVGEHDAWELEHAGVSFVLQNNEAGIAAIGTTGEEAGLDFAKAVGAVFRVGKAGDTLNRYGFGKSGMGGGATKDSNAIAGSNGDEVQVKVTYDGTTLRSVWTCNGTERTVDWAVNLANELGTDFAWIGFAGATDATVGAELTVRNFTFRGGAYMGIPEDIVEANWEASKYAPSYKTLDDGTPCFRMTKSESDQRSAVWNKTRISVNRPFRLSFKYRVPEHASADPADGIAVAIQNFGAAAGDCYGATGGSLGIVYGTPRARTVGWGVSIYPNIDSQKFKFVKDGSFNGDPVPFTAWDLSNGVDTQFELVYDMETLTLTATRDNFSQSVSRAVDLAAEMEDNTAWIGFTGSCGGSNALQYIWDIHFAYEELDLSSRYVNPFVVDGATALDLGVGAVGFANLTLKDGASLTASSKVDGASLELGGTTLEGDAAVSSAADVPVVLQDTIKFTNGTGTLKLVGDVRANGTVTIDLAKFKGVRKVLDLTEATHELTAEDFTAVGVQTPLKWDILNGVLRVWHDVSTAIIFR